MATKLKNLKVTSVDIVNAGANPDAHIRLYKSRDEEAGATEEQSSTSAFKSIVEIFGKLLGLSKKDVAAVAKDTETFGTKITGVECRQITSEMWDYSCAFSDSLLSIACDTDLNAQVKKAMMYQSLDEFAETTRIAIDKWGSGNTTQAIEKAGKDDEMKKAQDVPQRSVDTAGGICQANVLTDINNKDQEEEMDTMKIDKSKMSAEELDVLYELEKKYGVDDTATSKSDEKEGLLEKSNTELHPEVKKALDEVAEMKKSAFIEVEKLKQSLEIEKLSSFAKKYEMLGKQPEELAKKLFEIKKAGGTAYDDYIGLLDEQIAMVEKGAMFTEIGKNTVSGGDAHTKIEKAAAELRKDEPSLTREAAFVKACELHPELHAEYENEYSGRRI